MTAQPNSQAAVIEEMIEAAWHALCVTTCRESRAAAQEELRRVHALRSAATVRRMERKLGLTA